MFVNTKDDFRDDFRDRRTGYGLRLHRHPRLGTLDRSRLDRSRSLDITHTSPARSPEITPARSPEIATPADGRADPRGDGVHPHPRRRRRGVDGPRRPSGEQAARRAVAAPLARGCALALRRRAAAARGRPLPLAGGVCPRGGWRARERGERAREVGGSPDTSPAPDAHPIPAPLALRRAAPFTWGLAPFGAAPPRCPARTPPAASPQSSRCVPVPQAALNAQPPARARGRERQGGGGARIGAGGGAGGIGAGGDRRHHRRASLAGARVRSV